MGGATFFAFPVSVCIGSGANFASSCAFLRLFLLVFYFYLYYSYYCFLFLCFHLFRSVSIHRGFWVSPIPAERMSPPAEPLTGGKLIPPGGRQVPQGWPLMTNVPIRHVAVPSTARYPVAAHCCLGFGIFYRGCHLRGPANEDPRPIETFSDGTRYGCLGLPLQRQPLASQCLPSPADLEEIALGTGGREECNATAAPSGPNLISTFFYVRRRNAITHTQ